MAKEDSLRRERKRRPGSKSKSKSRQTGQWRKDRILYAVGGTLLAIGLVYVIASWEGTPPYQLTVEFSTGRGIAAGDPVRYRGQTIGEVQSTDVTDEGVFVVIEIPSRFSILITEDVRFFAVQKIPLAAQRGVYLFRPNDPEGGRRDAKQVPSGSRVVGETSQTEYWLLVAESEGMTGVAEIADYAHELMDAAAEDQ